MIDKNDLLSWLKDIDRKLKKDITLIAVGGTAMTLLGLKPSTRDIDFCIDSKDKKDFEAVLDKKFVVDIFVDGYIFSEQLPDDYKDISKDIVEMGHIKLKTLNSIDIVITKTARLNARDEEDIKSIAKHVDKEKLIKRFKQVIDTFAGREDDFKYHFNLVLKRYF